MDNLNGTDNPKNSRKEFRKTLATKLEEAFQEFKNGVKEKKFKAAVKRASKLLANDLFLKTKKERKKKQSKDLAVEEAEAINA